MSGVENPRIENRGGTISEEEFEGLSSSDLDEELVQAAVSRPLNSSGSSVTQSILDLGARSGIGLRNKTNSIGTEDSGHLDNTGSRQRDRQQGSGTDMKQVNLFGCTVQAGKRIAGISTRAPFIQRQARPFNPVYLSPPSRRLHTFDDSQLKSWQYPTNVPIREYQRAISERAILCNLMVSLPTGLGKTLIAAVVMLNFYRWTMNSKVVFMAPTRPLVAQQAEACYRLVGIPRDDTAVLVGSTTPPAARVHFWKEKRVFFVTPQTFEKDLKAGVVDPKSIVCLVVDEAHRATGDYSYVAVVQFIARFNQQFRVLAMSATPGSSVEAVQEVVTNLGISHAEIRTEKSQDVAEYIRGTEVEHVSAALSPACQDILDAFGRVLYPLITELVNGGVYFQRDPTRLSLYGLLMARNEARNQMMTQRMAKPRYFKYDAIFSALISIAHGVPLIRFHGIKPFWQFVQQWKEEQFNSKKKPGKWASEIVGAEWANMESVVKNYLEVETIGHEKLEKLVGILTDFFLDEEVIEKQSKVIIFCEYRSSAMEVQRTLEKWVPSALSHPFFGQASKKEAGETVSGMTQKVQQQTLDEFKQGKYNTLIATSVGEEGLDIGQVDMIICFDASASPVRVLQRMGRTGRFRKGRIVALLTESERSKWDEALLKYEAIQESMTNLDGLDFVPGPRILPEDITPVIEEKEFYIPPENNEAAEASTLRKTRTKKKENRPPKKFFMPDDVNTSFTSASTLLSDSIVQPKAIRNRKAIQAKHSLSSFDESSESEGSLADFIAHEESQELDDDIPTSQLDGGFETSVLSDFLNLGRNTQYVASNSNMSADGNEVDKQIRYRGQDDSEIETSGETLRAAKTTSKSKRGQSRKSDFENSKRKETLLLEDLPSGDRTEPPKITNAIRSASTVQSESLRKPRRNSKVEKNSNLDENHRTEAELFHNLTTNAVSTTPAIPSTGLEAKLEVKENIDSVNMPKKRGRPRKSISEPKIVKRRYSTSIGATTNANAKEHLLDSDFQNGLANDTQLAEYRKQPKIEHGREYDPIASLRRSYLHVVQDRGENTLVPSSALVSNLKGFVGRIVSGVSGPSGSINSDLSVSNNSAKTSFDHTEEPSKDYFVKKEENKPTVKEEPSQIRIARPTKFSAEVSRYFAS
ncbi:uncharacterized protein V1516DRAFT_630733 [Lipomyces oligophaga]|uniref:uncharacterized protein n=1 Tax=Lipomyces oligophaga TaxID=45792 RepID=UPI0034CFB00C